MVIAHFSTYPVLCSGSSSVLEARILKQLARSDRPQLDGRRDPTEVGGDAA